MSLLLCVFHVVLLQKCSISPKSATVARLGDRFANLLGESFAHWLRILEEISEKFLARNEVLN